MIIRLTHVLNVDWMVTFGNSVLPCAHILFCVHFSVWEEISCLCECSNAMTWLKKALFTRVTSFIETFINMVCMQKLVCYKNLWSDISLQNYQQKKMVSSTVKLFYYAEIPPIIKIYSIMKTYPDNGKVTWLSKFTQIIKNYSSYKKSLQWWEIA